MFAIIENAKKELEIVPCEQGMTYRTAARVLKKLEQDRIDAPRLHELVRNLHQGAMERSQSHTDVIVKITDVIGVVKS